MLAGNTDRRLLILRLVKFDPEKHLTQKYVSWLNDPQTVRFSEQRHKEHTLQSCREYAESRANLLAIELDGDHIGNVDISFDSPNEVADIAILLGTCHNMGYGNRAFRLAMAICRDLGARKITCGTMAVNLPMRRIAEKCGMKEDGRRSGHFVCEGKEIDLIHYAAFNRPVQCKPERGVRLKAIA